MKSVILHIILFFSIFQSGNAHPLHISITNIEYSEKNENFNIIFKLNKEDFYQIINHHYGINFDSSFNDKNKFIIKSINSYINDNFEIKSGEKNVKIKFKKINFDNEFTWLYYNFTISKLDNEINIKNTILNDLFYDQNNLVIFKYKSFEKGYQLNMNKNAVNLNLN